CVVALHVRSLRPCPTRRSSDLDSTKATDVSRARFVPGSLPGSVPGFLPGFFSGFCESFFAVIGSSAILPQLRCIDASKLRKNGRSEEHTSEFQSRFDLVCRLLL